MCHGWTSQTYCYPIKAYKQVYMLSMRTQVFVVLRGGGGGGGGVFLAIFDFSSIRGYFMPS